MFLLTMLAAQATPERGLWMHYHSGDPRGTSTIIGDSTKEATAHARFSSWGIKRVYGGYQQLPVTDRADVANWNFTLDEAGIESQLLLGEATNIFPGPDCRGSLFNKIDARLRDFNLGVPGSTSALGTNERFKALHLDLEPHQFKASNYGTGGPVACAPTSLYWSDANRAVLFSHLYDTLVEVRNHMDTHDLAGMPIYIDLPFWIESSPYFDWSTTPGFIDGADWLQQTSLVVDGFTMMTYEKDNATEIRANILGEQTELPGYTIRPSVNPRERAAFSSIHTWTYVHELIDVIEELESTVGGLPEDVDIHNYRYLTSPWPLSTSADVAVDVININWGHIIVDVFSSKARLRPETVQRELAEIEAVAIAAGCTAGADNVWAGTSGNGAGTGQSTSSDDPMSFTYTRGQASGTLGQMSFGSEWSGTARTRVLADTDEGYLAGRWVRAQGRRGVWVAVNGTCEPGLDAQEVFSNWYDGR